MPNFGTIDECFQPDTVCYINFGLSVVVVNYLLLPPVVSAYSLNEGCNSFRETFGLFMIIRVICLSVMSFTTS